MLTLQELSDRAEISDIVARLGYTQDDKRTSTAAPSDGYQGVYHVAQARAAQDQAQ